MDFQSDPNNIQKPFTTQARRNEKKSEGAINYVILSATMVGQRRKLFISKHLKRLEKRNICRRQVM